MPRYQLYHLNPFSGHIDHVVEFFASDNVGAIHAIQQRKCRAPMELWLDGRKIGRFEPSREETASLEMQGT